MDRMTLIYLLIGTALMAAVLLLCRKKYAVPAWKSLLFSVLLTIIGVISVKLMFFIENGNFTGLSFFGAVFFVPLLDFPLSLLLKIPYPDLLDLSAPSVSTMLSVMKINCLVSGCCAGKILYTDETGGSVRFPSQLFEMAVAFLIAVALIIAIKKDLLRHMIFPSFMILYGSTRFVLNLFRETDDFFFGAGIGSMWALIAIIAALIWIFIFSKSKTRDSFQPKNVRNR